MNLETIYQSLIDADFQNQPIKALFALDQAEQNFLVQLSKDEQDAFLNSLFSDHLNSNANIDNDLIGDRVHIDDPDPTRSIKLDGTYYAYIALGKSKTDDYFVTAVKNNIVYLVPTYFYENKSEDAWDNY